MERFSLEKYLKNPSRKITTRLGNRKVRIICTDRKAKLPIVTLMTDQDGNEYVTYHTKNGWCDEGEKYIDKRDLFFADDEEELTEFEKEVAEAYEWAKTIEREEFVKEFAPKLLNLARKELEKEVGDKCWEAHLKGEEEALKSLPKWKKANVFVSNEFGLTTRNDDLIITHNGYQIKLSDLKSLPKEE